MDSLTIVSDIATIVGAVATVIGVVWGFFVYWRNRDKVSAALNALRQYSARTTISELNAKLDHLARLTTVELSDREATATLLADIHGQIEGHRELRQSFRAELRSIDAIAKSQEAMFEYNFRRLVSRLREMLKQRDIEGSQENSR